MDKIDKMNMWFNRHITSNFIILIKMMSISVTGVKCSCGSDDINVYKTTIDPETNIWNTEYICSCGQRHDTLKDFNA